MMLEAARRGHKRMDIVSNSTAVGRGIKQLPYRCQIVKKILPKLIHLHHQSELLIQQRMDLCFRVLYAVF